MAVKTVWPIHHQCGHDQDHDLSEKRASERAGFARWLASRDCAECWRMSREAKETRASQAQFTERSGHRAHRITLWERRSRMPRLEGSDKAIEWARRVRFDLLTAAYACVDTENGFVVSVEEPAKSITSASWWIDQRDADPESLSELVLDAAGDCVTNTGSGSPC